MAGRIVNGVDEGVTNLVQSVCCDCWTGGCGINPLFGVCGDGLETLNPIMEYIADLIWFLGSPLAFPLVFCFDAPNRDEMDPPGGGWHTPMINTPIVKPLMCCGLTMCAPCGQFWLRRRLLDNDMSRYKLWQGYHDGPHCFARRCPGAPITIEAGTYGESQCPNTFLAMEVCCLGGCWSTCCAFNVNRRLIKERITYLKDDPLEIRVNKCIGFFSELASKCCMLGCCICITARCIGCCVETTEGQECSEAGIRAGNSCRSCARTCWRGIWSVKFIAMGCMSTQMDIELRDGGQGPPPPKPPTGNKMTDRGASVSGTDDDDNDDDDNWWKKDPNKDTY